MANSPLPNGSDVVDSHCHCGDVFYEPIDVLLYHMDSVGVAKAVLVQYFGQYDNAYQTAAQKRYPDRLASLVLVNTDSPTAIQEVDAAIADGARGIRFRPSTRSPGDDPFALWRAAEERGLVASCMGSLAAFESDDFFAIVEAFPNLRITIEHAGSSNRPNLNGDIDNTRERLFELGKYDNVYLKFGGLGEFYLRHTVLPGGIPFERPATDYLQRAYAAFGPRRLLWSSDFPPVSAREGYRNALLWPLQEFSHLPAEEQAMIFGGNTNELFFS